MITRDVDFLPHKGDGCVSSNPSALVDQLCSRTGNTVFKSGPLFISSKGIGWTSWKKRWFILTRTSLVFFRNDPNALSQKGSEVNLTLGGIDLNNSGSVVVRADKKLLTVLFPDGRDGRAFTLKAETSEDMYEWKTALENALAQAPSAVLVMGQNGFFRNDAANAFEGSFEQWRVKRNVKSLVVGRPILLVLEDIDGCPSFLEKALRFIEQYGVKVEGILRQAADVDEVERRIQEYEHGKNEFSPDEDAHVIADCVKYVLRELPSSPVPAACCSSLLEAFRSNRGSRVTAFCAVIFDAFPEPNRRLLQRILKMMQTVASHKAQNLMSTSAVAACMAPLLLRPLLAGDCDSSDDFDMGADGSMQLLQAAAAANHAQAIIVTLLEEFDNIFLDKGSFSPALCSQSDGSGSEDKDSTDDEILEENGYHDVQNDIDPDIDHERSLSGLLSESSGSGSSEIYHNKAIEGLVSDLESPKVYDKASKPILTSLPQCDSVQIGCNLWNRSDNCYAMTTIEPHEGYLPTSTSPKPKLRQREHTSTSTGLSPSSCITTKSTNKYDEHASSIKRPAIWDCSSARKNLSAESIEYSSDDEMMIQRLEMSKTDLQNRIAKEEKGNAILHASLERRKQALHERRLTLEQDVLKLQMQLQKERDLRTKLEAGLNIPLGQLCISSKLDSKTRVELEEIALAEADVVNLKKKVADLHLQLNQQHQHNYGPLSESFGRNHFSFNYQSTMNFEHRETESTDTTDTVFHCGRFPGSEPSQTQQQNPISKNSDKCSGASASFSEEPLTVGPGNWSASSGRDEGMVSAQSALIKLTNRLSFLKERRSHLVNELQTIEIRSIPISDGPPFTGAPQWAITSTYILDWQIQIKEGVKLFWAFSETVGWLQFSC